MEVRNVTPEEIEQAMEETAKQYGGNLYLKSHHVRVKLDKPKVRDESYTVNNVWVVYAVDEDGNETWKWHNPDELRARRFADSERKFNEEMIEKYGDIAEPIDYVVRFEEEHYQELIITDTHTYEYTKALALNKKGTRYRVWIGVKSSRRPGARVSQERYGLFGMSNNKPKRIGSACWHAHRDFFREIFAINPDAVIVTALARYNGEEDFEDKFPATAHSGGMAGPAPIQSIGDACNCDEGEHPEFAVEGLTEEQYEMRLDYWGAHSSYATGWYIPQPKREKALLSSRGREEEGE